MDDNNIPEVDYSAEIVKAQEWAKARFITIPPMEQFKTGVGGRYVDGDLENYIAAAYKKVGIRPSIKYRQETEARDKAIKEAEKASNANTMLEPTREEHRQKGGVPPKDDPLGPAFGSLYPARVIIPATTNFGIKVRYDKTAYPALMGTEFGPGKFLTLRTSIHARKALKHEKNPTIREKIFKAFPELRNN